MTITQDGLGAFGSLARALGIVGPSAANAAWFGDPMGGSTSNPNGLKTVLADDGQRQALVDFVDEVLGPPEEHQVEGQQWVPLFRETDPDLVVYAVLEPVPGAVRIGVAAEYATGDEAPCAKVSVHVPIFQVPRTGTDSRTAGAGLPKWLFLGQREARIEFGVEATFTDDPPVSGQAHLGGARARVGIPTLVPGDSVDFALTLLDLQLPGSTTPTSPTLSVDSPDELGAEVFEFIVGLLRQQLSSLDLTDDALRHISGLAGILGLTDVTDLPAFPLADLPERGLSALVDWLTAVVSDDDALDAWLGELARLVGGTARPARNAVEFAIGPARLLLGLDVGPGSTGSPVLVPWVELAWSPSAGADVGAMIHLLRADTGTGAVTAIPSMRAQATFGALATGGSDLLTGTPGVGSLRIGIALDEHQRPCFALTVHDVDLPGGRHHDLLDLSSPEAALDAANDVIGDALGAALDGFGDVGDLLKALLGIDPPGAVAALAATDVLTDPLGALRGYYEAVVADADAMAELIGTLRRLLTGAATAPAPGLGTAIEPWRLDVADGVGLRFWRDGPVLVLGLGARVETPVLDDLTAVGAADIELLRTDLTTGATSFGATATGRLLVEPRGTDPLTLDLTLARLVFHGLGVRVAWRAGTGLRVAMDGGGVELDHLDPRSAVRTLSPIPLPVIGADGSVTFTPDWAVVESVLTTLLGEARIPVLDAALDLVGWRGGGAHLALAALVADPATAVATWATDLALDCDNLRTVLGPVAVVLSGGRLDGPLGSGRPDEPFRCPIAGESRAPGLAVWTVPGCRPRTSFGAAALPVLSLVDGMAAPTGPEIAARLRESADDIPSLRDLLFSRTRLGDGLADLMVRLAGTDGVIAPTEPAGVTSRTLVGHSYASLSQAARTTGEALAGVTGPVGMILQVGATAAWLDGIPAATAIDATVSLPSTLPQAATGTWSVRLPDPVTAAAARTDRDGVQGQADALAAVLAARTTPVVLVAHGAAAAAALRAAATTEMIATVVTVGAPWTPEVPVTALTDGLSGDALRFLDTLAGTTLPPMPDDFLAISGSQYWRGAALVRRARDVTGADTLPTCQGEAIRTGLQVHALFGRVDAGDVARALAALVVGAVSARQNEASTTILATTGRPTEVHAGLDLPVLDLDLAGLTVGVGASIDLVSVRRTAPTVRTLREVAMTLRFGVTDGWLVGGPGATDHDLEVRWAELDLRLPLDGGEGSAEFVLHDARAYAAHRERWVVRPDGDGSVATAVLPEVRILLSEIARRLRTASPELATLLTTLGVLRADGLDPDAIDRIVHDPVATLLPIIRSRAADVARDLRALLGPPPTGLPATVVRFGDATAYVEIDCATGAISAAATLALPEAPPLSVTLTAGAGAAPQVRVHVGGLDPVVGGIRLVATAGVGGVTAALEDQRPGAATTSLVSIHPNPDVDGLTGILTRLLPATLAQALARWFRGRVTDEGLAVLDAGLVALGLLGPVSDEGSRDVVLPVGLFTDPGAWLRTRTDPLAATVAVLEALAPVVVPTRAAGVQGWPILPELTITYAVTAGRLEVAAALALDTTIDNRDIGTRVSAGLSISATGEVRPLVAATATVDDTGLALRVAPTLTPPVTLALVRATPAAPIMLYPAGAGIGPAIGAAAGTVIRLVLNEIIGHRGDAAATPLRAVARAVHEAGAGLDLLVNDEFTDARITTFAEHPEAALLGRLPHLVTNGLSALVQALDPSGTKVAVEPATGGARRITFGTGRHVHLILDGATPALEFGCDIEITDRDDDVVGRIVVERLRLTPTGVQVALRGGPFAIPAGPLVLRPEVVIRAGITSGGFTRLLGIGLALDAVGAQALECRWHLDASAPYLASITRDTTGEHEDADPEDVALSLLGLAVSIATSVIAAELDSVVSTRATRMLQGVLLTGGDLTIDPQFFTALTRPDLLLARVKRLAWNAATDAEPLSLTIDSTVTLGLAHRSLGGGREALGVNVTLVPGQSFDFPTSGVGVALEVDATWITGDVVPGLSIYVLEGTIDDLDLVPGFSIMGIGLRFTNSSGPLLDLGSIQLDGIAFHVYAEATGLGVGGGANLELIGLGIAPGGGGDNGVANNIMNDVGSSSANNRPVFSPSLAIQRHPGPGQDVQVGLRAGDPPGPWWIVIQRQLGPLYVDRIGLNTVEAGGRVTEISLLFNGQLSIFGMTAAVDRLSITWHGGDVLAISSWSVDLMGLAISADLGGLMLAGGLLKIVDGTSTGYVGMLMGRFAAYGLSVFGGYTQDGPNASFFVFGAINGPIGGPPAFFLTGLGGGLGINRGLVIPEDISQFGTFPFIQALDPGAKPPERPMDELHRLSSIFPHQMGNFWFAAGISFTCFSLVDGVAVVAVSFGNGLEINLLGLARMALPRPGAALVSIELALLARFSTREGVFMIKAQLTDNSWLLTESIRLTGGFAFAIWWKGPLAGQFVLTMGGYHPSFHRDGYPDVPRLGIMWRISDYLVIKGGSYFALTSEALMAGTSIEASLDLGFVWAKLSFGADGIIYFDPFWFEVSAYCRISAGINLDLGLFTISFSITLGATIKVWGPDFAGRAEFEIGPCTIPVEFGSKRKVKGAPLPWTDFVLKYLEDAGGRARALSGITGRGTLPSATGGKTAAPSSDGTIGLPYRVFAEFELTFVTTIPTQSLVIGTARPPAVAVTLPDGTTARLGLSPMNAAKLTSTLTISLELVDPVTHATTSTAADGQPLATKLARLAERWGQADAAGPSTDAFPIGAWGEPEPANLTVKPLPAGDVLRTGNGMRLVAGVEMPQVGPDINYYQVEAGRRPLPLLATGNQRSQFLAVSAALPGSAPGSAAAALELAADRLFADRGAGATLRRRGGHSALAAAAFAGERSAPPLFGTLTDGLAKKNGADGIREEQEPPAEPTGRRQRSPFVAGYLTGGSGAAIRSLKTTVGDGRIKRRPAPTVESVSGRLGRSLPLSLTRAATPAAAVEGTVVAAGLVPRTDAVGSAGRYAGGRFGNAALQAVVTGLELTSNAPRAASRSRRRPKADALASTVRSGDLVVLQFPDARTDTDDERRPTLGVTGKARVSMLRGNHAVLDEDVADATVTVPAGVTHLAVHADGDVDPTDGWAGWHLGSRVARVGSQGAVAAGCLVTVDSVTGESMMAWDTAAPLVRDADLVVTRFSRPVSTVAIALTGDRPRDLDPTELILLGGQVATRRGAPVPPTAVTIGDTSVLVYAVVPDTDATSITVKVAVGGDWSVAGVVGSAASPADAAADIAARRLSGVTAKLLAVAGQGTALAWTDPPAPRRPRTRRPR